MKDNQIDIRRRKRPIENIYIIKYLTYQKRPKQRKIIYILKAYLKKGFDIFRQRLVKD